MLVLDDATSSIDVRLEEEIHRTLRRIMAGRTTLLVAHRRSTLKLADRIVVVDDGRVVDTGTEAELLERCALFRSLLAGPDADIDTPVEEPDDSLDSDAPPGGTPPPGGITPEAWRPPADDDTTIDRAARLRRGAGPWPAEAAGAGGGGMGIGRRASPPPHPS